MSESTGQGATLTRLETQLDRLIADGCCDMDEMIVFPAPRDSSALAELARDPTVTIERIGPDVVRIRRTA